MTSERAVSPDWAHAGCAYSRIHRSRSPAACGLVNSWLSFCGMFKGIRCRAREHLWSTHVCGPNIFVTGSCAKGGK